MTIKVGDKLPSATLFEMTDSGPSAVSTDDLVNGKKVVLFSVPGAFTPTCSNAHLPGYVQNARTIKAKGVDTIACVSVNDAFVMGAWGEAQSVGDNVTLLADGSGDLAKAMDVELDLASHGLGVRSAPLLDDPGRRASDALQSRRGRRVRGEFGGKNS